MSEKSRPGFLREPLWRGDFRAWRLRIQQLFTLAFATTSLPLLGAPPAVNTTEHTPHLPTMANVGPDVAPHCAEIFITTKRPCDFPIAKSCACCAKPICHLHSLKCYESGESPLCMGCQVPTRRHGPSTITKQCRPADWWSYYPSGNPDLQPDGQDVEGEQAMQDAERDHEREMDDWANAIHPDSDGEISPAPWGFATDQR